MAVGQVDILVGVPTFNNADTVSDALKTVHLGLARHFPRQRTLTLNSDGGSEDGTPEIIRALDLPDELTAGPMLRTVHRISVPTHGLPGKGSGLRTIFAAGDLLQAKAIVIIDPEVTSLTPDWIKRFALPVIDDGADFVAPVYTRHPLDGLLVTQFVRPMFRATYGWRVQEPLCGEFSCSGRYASHCLDNEDVQNMMPTRANVWLPAVAAAHGFRIGQAALGPREIPLRHPRPALPDLLQDVVGSLFACLETHADYWMTRQGAEAPNGFTTGAAPAGDDVHIDVEPMAESFKIGFRELEGELSGVLTRKTLTRLRQIANLRKPVLDFADELWVRIIYEFAGAHHHSALWREHLAQALVPMYLGRTASFLSHNIANPPDVVHKGLEALCAEYERAKPHLVERWTGNGN